MARHVWSVLCMKSSIDRDENIVSLLAVTQGLIIDSASADELEDEFRQAKAENRTILIPASLHFVSWWVRSDYDVAETITVRYQVVPPHGRPLPQPPVVLPLEEHTNHRLRWRFDSFPFLGFGLLVATLGK